MSSILIDIQYQWAITTAYKYCPQHLQQLWTVLEGGASTPWKSQGQGRGVVLIQMPLRSSERLTGRFSSREVGGHSGWKGDFRLRGCCMDGGDMSAFRPRWGRWDGTGEGLLGHSWVRCRAFHHHAPCAMVCCILRCPFLMGGEHG